MSLSDLGQNVEVSVSKFYEGKSVFITGCSGFLGSVILETLLKCVPGIGPIYILLRSKRGESAESRLATIWNKKLFEHLTKTQPEVFEKVHMVAGDLTLPALGLSDSDRQRLIDDVSVVFHCAASLHFNKSLKFMLSHNVLGTKYILDLCKEMGKLEVLLYTSTVSTNPYLPKLKEQVYKMPVSAQQILDVMENEDEDALEQLVSKFIKKWPNTYTFSKNVSENLVRECSNNIPTAIIRTSLIGPCWKGTVPGYVETSSSAFTFGSAIGKGLIRVVHCDPDVPLSNIPADISANTHIVVGWALATQKVPPFLVVNCVKDEEELCFRLYSKEICKLIKHHPMPKAFMEPSLTLCKYTYTYWAYAIYEHYVPALVIDFFLILRGKKPRVFNGYRLYDRTFKLFSYFLYNSIQSDNKVFRSIREKHTGPDSELFYLDIENFSMKDTFDALPYGSVEFDWSRDDKTKKERRIATLKHTIMMRSIKLAELIFLMFLMYQIIKHFLPVIGLTN